MLTRSMILSCLCSGMADVVMEAKEEEAAEFAVQEFKEIFKYDQNTICDTQDRAKGGFVEWKRRNGVEGADDDCLR